MENNELNYLTETVWLSEWLGWDWLTYSWAGNSTADWLMAGLILILALVVFKIFREYILRKLARLARQTKTDVDETMVEIVRSLRPPFYIILSVFVAANYLTLPDWVETGLFYMLLLWLAYQVGIAGGILADYLLRKKLAEEAEPQTRSALFMLSRIAKGVIWVVVVLFAVANLGVDVTSFVATLGIGGVAVALALQNILSDLFSSFSIYFDKPFQVGDFIMVGEHMGTVERIGIKSTRIRSINGEEIVISNRELTTARIQNYKRLEEWRSEFHFTLDYNTSPEQLEYVPVLVKEVIDSQERTRIDRVHFRRFGESGLEFEAAYYYQGQGFNDFLDTQQQINIEIKRRLEHSGAQFAFPTRIIYQR